ncbi:DNA-binding protein Ikaros isoform X2 [Thrips palmi]|uniref:DNA-binding protein Ikaros isoform X2 n=1 Tax=Thrips palmi TaxID=161013 RepID=A0A6P8Z663_THRPL|nr:DNA-binding protein Ikaros isoform X2 [Thrips palmi]
MRHFDSIVNMTGVEMRGGGAPGPGPGHGLGLTIDACVESDGRHSGGEDVVDDDCSESGLLRCARCDFDTPNRITFIAHLSECNGEGQVVEGGDTSPDRHNRKLFECDVCNMKFSNGANMRRHKMRHTGVKPYECRVCQKRFFRKDHLAEHFTTHTKTLPYHCPICHRGFQRQIAMRAHFQNEHVGQHDMVKSCPLCSFQAPSMKSLRVHFFNRHGIDLDNPGPSLGIETSGNPGVNGGLGATLGSAIAGALVASPIESGESTPPMHFLTPHVEISMADPPGAYSPGQNEHANGSGDVSGDPSSPQSADSASLSAVNTSSLPMVRRDSPDLGLSNSITNGSPPQDVSLLLLPVKQENFSDASIGAASCGSGSGSGEEGDDDKRGTNGAVNLTTCKDSAGINNSTRLIKVSPLKSLLRDDGKRPRLISSRPRPELLPVNRPALSGPPPDPSSANNTPAWQLHPKLQCNFCGIAFPDQTLYFMHKGCHSDTNPWKCNICGEQCSSVYDFNAHLLSKSHQ